MSLPIASTVLIIDDNPDNLQLLTTMLESHSYQVKKAISPKLALQVVQNITPDLILLDINMPDMDGYEVCQQLKSMPQIRDIPIIFISICLELEDKVKAFQLGGVDYITKPFEVEEVIARVKNQLNLYHLQKQFAKKSTQLEQVNQELSQKNIDYHQAQAALRQSEAQAQLLFNSNPHPMWVYDLETLAILEVNEAAICHYGYSKAEFLTMTIADIHLADDVPNLLNIIAQKQTENYLNSGIWQHRKKNGKIIEVEIISNAITFNHCPARIILAQDVTQQQAALRDRDRLEQNLRQQAEDLAIANHLKDEFLAIISHELRTPLNAILGWSSMLRSYQLDTNATDEAIESIYRNALVQTQLTEDLLNVSEMMRGKLHLQPVPVNLNKIIAEAVQTMYLAASAKQIALKSTFDNTQPILIRADANRMQQILWNLISNAIKFTPAGGQVEVELARLYVSKSELHKQEYAVIKVKVSDTGIGISPEFLPYVFDRFRQAESALTRSFSGMGLGLSIVRNLVELHGGTVNVESLGTGQGATFSVSLPLLAYPYTQRR